MSKIRMMLPAFALLAACNPQSDAVAQSSAGRPFAVAQIADFDSPWAMTFLPDGRMLVTEKQGQLLLVAADGKTRSVVAGTPTVSSEGQGALMDVVLHPRFAENRLVYLSW
ncbi:MAG: PQQ-dependent sugar dehydrogenase, partial [Sphingomonadales bacterium]